MKTLFYSLFFVFLMWGCNSNQTLSEAEKANVKTKAEALYLNFFRYFNELKFDSAVNVFSKDVYCMADGELWNYDRLKQTFENYLEKRIIKVNFKADSLRCRVIAKDAVHIVAYYTMIEVDTANNMKVSKGVQSVLVNPNLKEGYISEFIENNDYTPMLFEEKVAKEFQTGYSNLNWRHEFGLAQFQLIWLYHVSVMKQKGISPDKAGEMLGKTFAPSWNKSTGFDGFSNHMVFAAQSLWSKSKVLERNKNMIKVELSKDYTNSLPILKITDEDAVVSFSNCWKPIADYMGATMEMENRDKTFILTFTRK